MPRRLKILLSNFHGALNTGSGVQLYALAKGLAERGHDVSVIFNYSNASDLLLESTLDKFEAAGVRLIRFPFAKLKYSFTLPSIFELGHFLYREQFDLVHTFAGMDLNFFFITYPFIPRTVIIANRGVCSDLDVFNGVKYRMPMVSRVVAVAEGVADSMVRSGGLSREKIEVVYGGIDLERFDPEVDGAKVREELGLGIGDAVIGLIGKFNFSPGHMKGGLEFLEAAKLIEDRREIRYLLVGDVDRADFLKSAAPLGLEDRFVLTGFREDVERIIAACDFIVCPSIKNEGLTGVVREALAMKRAVVCTDVGGNRELVSQNETGLMVPPGDPAALAEAMRRLLDDPSGRERMGAAGRGKVEAMCGDMVRLERIERIYEETVEAPPRMKAPASFNRALNAIVSRIMFGKNEIKYRFVDLGGVGKASGILRRKASRKKGPRLLDDGGVSPGACLDPARLDEGQEVSRDERRRTNKDKIKKWAARAALMAAIIVPMLIWPYFFWELFLAPSQRHNASGRLDNLVEIRDPKAPRIALLGDCRGHLEALEGILEDARAREADAAIILGDIVMKGTAGRYRFVKREIDEAAGPMPVFAVIGNHDLDGGDGGDGSRLFEKFFGPTRFWLRHGNHFFVAINNVQEKVWQDELEWLRSALMDNAREEDEIYLLLHMPPSLEGWEGFHGMSAKDSEELWSVISRYPNLKIFAAHIHEYREYSFHGIPVVVTGEAGAPQHKKVAEHGYVLLDLAADDLIAHKVSLGRVSKGDQFIETFALRDFFWGWPFITAAAIIISVRGKRRGR